MMHFPMRAWRSLSQREGGASGTDVEEEKGRRDVGCCTRGRARRDRRARGNMSRVGGLERPGNGQKRRKMSKKEKKIKVVRDEQAIFNETFVGLEESQPNIINIRLPLSRRAPIRSAIRAPGDGVTAEAC